MQLRVLAAALALLFLAPVPGHAIDSREELREAYESICRFEDASPYEESPQVTSPYSLGRISAAAQEQALEYLNFLRSLAGLSPVEANSVYSFECQHGAVLMAALDDVEHALPQPDDMDDGFYREASAALASSNIARFNWMRPEILMESVSYFMRDDGDENLPVLGHRRWLLDPAMRKTGFGLANSASHMTYVALYAHDMTGKGSPWGAVCWPSAGVFPVELMHSHLAWSIMLDPAVYDIDLSQVDVSLEEMCSGKRFDFRCSEGNGNGFCAINRQNYAASACAIFRPDLEGAGFTDYLQNQMWHVAVSGLVDLEGNETGLDYTVSMVSLYEQPVFSVEFTQDEIHLTTGEKKILEATVVPSYADDLSLTWSSSDPSIAVVDPEGTVTALAPGQCAITASSANGRSGTCNVQVS